jgi:hypothetical protein
MLKKKTAILVITFSAISVIWYSINSATGKTTGVSDTKIQVCHKVAKESVPQLKYKMDNQTFSVDLEPVDGITNCGFLHSSLLNNDGEKKLQFVVDDLEPSTTGMLEPNGDVITVSTVKQDGKSWEKISEMQSVPRTNDYNGVVSMDIKDGNVSFY